jgi:glycosyltransferase involved in cell wall biosynthesis
MCTYNGERFIKEQIDSILNQTYQNFELIITDDCSTDNTINILNEYALKDKRIIIYKNEINLGFLKNFEKAISLCNGDYIALADQDDIWKPIKLEAFLNNIKDNVLIYSDAIHIDKDSKEIGSELIRSGRQLIKGACNEALLLNNIISGNTLMFKKELVKYILPIPEKISYHDIWIGFVAATYGTIDYTEESMTYYRKYREQVTNVDKVSNKNFLDKLNNKKIRWMEIIDERAQDLEVFKTLSILKDKETIQILDNLIFHFKNYNNIYFNTRLYSILKKSLTKIFLIYPPSKRKRKAFRISAGLKLKTMTFFKL